MSTSIDNAFIRQYESDVKHVFQREGGYLRPAVRMKTGVVGKSTTFQKVGKGVATTKARHGVVTPMNQDHTAIECLLADFYAPDYVDRLDEAKTNIDERMVIAQGGAWAIGRKVDNQILTELDATTQTAVTITVTSRAAIRAGFATWAKELWANDVPNDGMVFGVMTPTLWAQAELLDEFSSADWVSANGRPYEVGMPTGGKMRDWKGIKWMMHTDSALGIDTTTAKGWIWHKTSIGYGAGAHANNNAENDAVRADIWWDGSRQAHLITHCMSGGAKLIDDTGVIEATWNDTTAIATS
jgi:hypothetical protein